VDAVSPVFDIGWPLAQVDQDVVLGKDLGGHCGWFGLKVLKKQEVSCRRSTSAGAVKKRLRGVYLMIFLRHQMVLARQIWRLKSSPGLTDSVDQLDTDRATWPGSFSRFRPSLPWPDSSSMALFCRSQVKSAAPSCGGYS
jgi:hypothetical protein